MNIINLSCNIPNEENPWSLIGQSYTDISFLIGGKKILCHQAILAQHSSMLSSIFEMFRCCKCLGSDCVHETKEIRIILDDVKIEVFERVMEIVYDGCGKVPEDVEEFRDIVHMLNLDSFFIREKKDENGNKQKLEDFGTALCNDIGIEGREGSREKEQIITGNILDINEIELDLCDTMGSFEDENFSVAVQKIKINDGPEDFPPENNLALAESGETIPDNDIREDDIESCSQDDDDEIDIYDYDSEDDVYNEEVDNGYNTNDKEHIEHAGIKNGDNDIELRSFELSCPDTNEITTDDGGDDIIEIKLEDPPVENVFSIRNHLLSNKSIDSGQKTQTVSSSSPQETKAQLLLDKLDKSMVSISSNKDANDKLLLEDSIENQLEDTLSEFTDLLKSKNSATQKQLGNSATDLKYGIREDAEKEPSNVFVYHCPFENCSYSNKRPVDFHTHIGARHYRTKIQELYPNFIHKYCDRCEKTFSVTGNYYTHMAKHENLPYLSKADIVSLGRLEPSDFSKETKVKKEADSDYPHDNLTSREKEDANRSNNSIPTIDYDDDIVEISPPKRKMQSLKEMSIKKQKG